MSFCSPALQVLSLGMAVSLCSGLSSAKLSGPQRGGDSPGLTVWLSASLLTRIQPSALPEQVPRGKAEALSTVPATAVGTSVLSLRTLVALEELWFVQEVLSSLSDTGEAVLSEEGRVLAVGSVLYFESA